VRLSDVLLHLMASPLARGLFQRGIMGSEVNPRDYVVHLYGNTAVMNFRVTVHEQFTDADIISEMRALGCWLRSIGACCR
jgi:hypothetical protein